MPKKGKRASQLAISAQRARGGLEKTRIDQESPDSMGPSTSQTILDRDRSLSTDPTDEDPTFDPAEEMSSNPSLKLEHHIEEWVCSVDEDDNFPEPICCFSSCAYVELYHHQSS